MQWLEQKYYPCCSLSSLSIKQRLNDIVCANRCVNECTPYVIVHIHRQEWCFLARGITLYHIIVTLYHCFYLFYYMFLNLIVNLILPSCDTKY